MGEKLAHGSGEAIEPDHHQDIPRPHIPRGRSKLRTVGKGAGHGFGEHPLASCRLQAVNLTQCCLEVSRDAGIANSPPNSLDLCKLWELL